MSGCRMRNMTSSGNTAARWSISGSKPSKTGQMRSISTHREIPASLVTDLATDPNGMVLQAANGRPAQIYVIVPVDGTLRIASGVVYNFYQFRQPLSARLTDTEWRQMAGEWMSPDGRFHQDETPEKPWWTQSYWVQG